ncbi:glycosyltransferase family 2 protein [Micromonospora sp.]|uniref:glycosyltransferase family 2 protein n=1 Tax=Micromonospora sp. TaxID=1876 RepID=UPI003B39FF0D
MVTVLVPAHNEAAFIARKIADSLAQDYPADRLEILVVDDGSADGTAEQAARCGDPRVRVVQQSERQGKSAALNRGVREARGEIVVCTDANGSLAPASVRAVVAAFDHPDVAVVSGRKLPIGDGAHGGGESAYWRYESALKGFEGRLGTVVGADGGIFAVRRSLFRDIPPGIFADDFWIPIDALSRGYRVRQANDACAFERTSKSKRDDFERRQRIAAGIWQVSLRHLHLADPRRGWTAVAFTWHRLMRSIAVPIALPVILVTSWLSARSGNRVSRALLAAQAAAYTAAAAGAMANAKPFAVPYQFAMSNVAALGGGYRHLTRRQTGLWKQTARGDWHPAAPGVEPGAGEPAIAMTAHSDPEPTPGAPRLPRQSTRDLAG